MQRLGRGAGILHLLVHLAAQRRGGALATCIEIIELGEFALQALHGRLPRDQALLAEQQLGVHLIQLHLRLGRLHMQRDRLLHRLRCGIDARLGHGLRAHAVRLQLLGLGIGGLGRGGGAQRVAGLGELGDRVLQRRDLDLLGIDQRLDLLARLAGTLAGHVGQEGQLLRGGCRGADRHGQAMHLAHGAFGGHHVQTTGLALQLAAHHGEGGLLRCGRAGGGGGAAGSAAKRLGRRAVALGILHGRLGHQLARLVDRLLQLRGCLDGGRGLQIATRHGERERGEQDDGGVA